jgi:hypothetical protein
MSCGVKKMWSKVAMKGVAVEVNPPKEVVDLKRMTELPKKAETPKDWHPWTQVSELVNTVRLTRNGGKRYCSTADLLKLGICSGYDASTGKLLQGARDMGVFTPCGSVNEYIENMLAFLFIGNKQKGSTPEEQYKKFQTWLVNWVNRNSHVVGIYGAWGKIPLVDATPVAKSVAPPAEEVTIDGDNVVTSEEVEASLGAVSVPQTNTSSVVLPSFAEMLKASNKVLPKKEVIPPCAISGARTSLSISWRTVIVTGKPVGVTPSEAVLVGNAPVWNAAALNDSLQWGDCVA